MITLEDLEESPPVLLKILSNRSLLDKIPTDMLMMFYRAGTSTQQWQETLLDRHTCEHREYRYIWPPEEGCQGCDHTLIKYARMFHLELPLLLLGRDAVIAEITRQFEMKEEQARVRRSLGSGI